MEISKTITEFFPDARAALLFESSSGLLLANYSPALSIDGNRIAHDIFTVIKKNETHRNNVDQVMVVRHDILGKGTVYSKADKALVVFL